MGKKLLEKSGKSFWNTLPGILTGLAAVIAAVGSCIAIVVASPRMLDIIFPATLTPIPTSTPTYTPISTPISTPTYASTPASTPHICDSQFQGSTDNETIVKLIQAEAIAANTKDISIIQAIFDPGAIFFDFASQPTKSWNGPLVRYRDDAFKTTDFKDVEHFDILPVGPEISDGRAYYTSGSKGKYRINDGLWNDFYNGSLVSMTPTPYGSEHWILKKNSIGCWTIIQMEFNAGHVKFPR